MPDSARFRPSPMQIRRLDTRDHSRESAGLTYVYPVISRRAGGVSVGINLNPNNACNWRCIYCQVPDLRRGIGAADRSRRARSANCAVSCATAATGDFMRTARARGFAPHRRYRHLGQRRADQRAASFRR
ncbi:MAG: hypothetical protein MZW92_74080 [Comamonadaceae bacterium]|nr:hypothetical protein [Comamonadaceae bacterium]